MAGKFPSESKVLSALSGWKPTDGANAFPHDLLVTHVRGVGKHFLGPELLIALDAVRGESEDPQPFLAGFLEVLLDKYDGRYHYPTYTALSLLRPAADCTGQALRSYRDRMVALLMADLIQFESAAAGGAARMPDGMQPGGQVADKRRRLATRVMAPPAYRTLEASGAPGPARTAPAVADPDALSHAVLAAATGAELRTLSGSLLPVYTLHDEYLFLRTLQAFEVTFSAMAGTLVEAVGVLRGERPGEAADLISYVADVLAESLPLFSLLATMQPESFRIFRQFTEGASAIQSEGYKTFESMCSTPGLDRLDSPAFTSVPRVRERVLSGQPTTEGTWEDVISTGWLDEAGAIAVREAARRLESTHQRWKQTHFRLAVRMIGTRTGTGSTEGVPYLESVLRNRLFRTLNEPATAAV